MKRKNFEGRVNTRREAAVARQAVYDKLTLQEKLFRLDSQEAVYPGPKGGFQRERERLLQMQKQGRKKEAKKDEKES